MESSIFIQGMCYSGKTTIGKQLAKSLNIEFWDSRDIFYNKHQMYDLDYLNSFGPEKFSIAEKESFLQSFGQKVVALSGSSLYLDDVMKNIKKKGILIWLKPTFDVIIKRKYNEELNNIIRPIVYPDSINSFEQLYYSRQILYQKWNPDIIIDIDINDSSSTVIQKITQQLLICEHYLFHHS